MNNQLVAVGAAIVWASRMAAVARANEVIVNNLLFSRLEGRGDIRFSARPETTKGGEGFLARRLEFVS